MSIENENITYFSGTDGQRQRENWEKLMGQMSRLYVICDISPGEGYLYIKISGLSIIN